MAMTLPIVLPSTPPSGSSPSPDAADQQPRTPVSPTMQTSTEQPQPQPQHSQQGAPPSQQAGNAASTTQMKRKPSRRANTAERRATHNAVERQRRETLNGRFLDLAALLPNLSQIRRPSKSSIVNSSIAHIHASRRHRILAARELRLVKLEADALRRELNEWRDRAGIPRIEEPIRGEGFSMVLSGELEVIAAIPGEEDDDDPSGQGYGGYGVDDGEDDYVGGPQGSLQSPMVDDMEDPRMVMMKGTAPNANPFAHSLPTPVVPTSASGHQGNNVHLAHILPRSAQSGMMSSPVFDSPSAMGGLYDHPGQFPTQFMHQHHQGGHHQSNHHQSPVDQEKLASWNMYAQQHQEQQQILQAQRSLFTPPATSHGLPSGSGGPASGGSGSPPTSAGGNPFADPASQAFFANFQRQQMMQHSGNGNGNGHGYSGSERDDASSVGSLPRGSGGNGPRERSGSVLSAGSGSGYGGSPPHHGHGGQGGSSPVGGYELGPGGAPSSGEQFAAGRRAWGREVVDIGVHHGHGHHGHPHHGVSIGPGMLPSPISAGGNGGGGGGGFAMAM